MDVQTRQALGELWVRWFVDRHDPRRVIDFNVDPPHVARALRIRELTDETIQTTLATEIRPDGSSIWSRIESHVKRFGRFEAVVFVAPAWPTRNAPMLIDGCHRASAIYLANPTHVEIDLTLVQPPDGLPDLIAVR